MSSFNLANVSSSLVYHSSFLKMCFTEIMSISFNLKHAFTEGYLQGDRQLSLVPVIISLCVTYVSAITMIGAGAEVYFYGVEMMFFVFSQVLR